MLVNVKEALINAGRYDQVIGIINNIMKIQPGIQVPVEGGKYVDNYDVINGARTMLSFIEVGAKIESESDIDAFERYVDSRVNMLLHNYAVSLSHRHLPDIDIDDIRCWQVLWSICQGVFIHFYDEGRDEPFEVSDGWKKCTGSNDIVQVYTIMTYKDPLVDATLICNLISGLTAVAARYKIPMYMHFKKDKEDDNGSECITRIS